MYLAGPRARSAGAPPSRWVLPSGETAETRLESGKITLLINLASESLETQPPFTTQRLPLP